LNSLVGIDPRAEEADATVDGRLVGVAGSVTPGRGSSKTTAADQGATAVTIAGRDCCGCDADMAVVDAASPCGCTGGIGHDGHGTGLEDGWETARGANVSTAPSGDNAARSSEVAVS
jgi:hypothetical protein